MHNYLQIFATLNGVAMAAAPFLQAYKALKRSSASDISIPSFSFGLWGCLVWVGWGLYSGDAVVLIANMVGLFSFGSVVTTAFILNSRKKNARISKREST